MDTDLKSSDEVFAPLKKDHKNALQFCKKIRAGLEEGISADRIKTYADFFFASQLFPLFCYEKETFFPVLGEEHKLVKIAKGQHELLKHLFEQKEDLENCLNEIVRELEEYINFQENEFFAELKREKFLPKISQLCPKNEEVLTPDPEDWDDKFWLKTNMITTNPSF